jgi:N-acyl-D-amino-acid deacylase
MKYDVALLHGTIIDPKTERSTVANLGFKDGKIAAVTRTVPEALQSFDVTGRIVCPGFIDPHTHVEGNKDSAELMVAMGVTSVLNGNCGMSPANFDEFMLQYSSQGFPVNQYEQVGHCTLRELAGNTDRYAPSSASQIEKMRQLADDAFKSGAYGLSFGLEYVPGSSKEEVLALAEIAAAYGRPVSIHTRTDYNPGLDALIEALDITRKTGAAVNISHLAYMYGFGMSPEALRLIETAKRDGLDISCDSGLYSGFATQIGSAVFDEGCVEKWRTDYSAIIAGTGKYKGQRLTRDMYDDMRKNYPEDTGIGMVGNEYEVYEILDRPYVMVGSDAGTLYDNGVPGHPQDAGTYPRFFRTMVREQNRISIVDAIRRCTYLPAKRFGFDSKGFIAEGADADIVVFDLARIKDTAQYPCDGPTDSRPEGIDYVFVNGILTVQGKKILPTAAGKLIRAENREWRW